MVYECDICSSLNEECPSCEEDRLQEEKWDNEDNLVIDEAMGLIGGIRCDGRKE